MCVLAYFYMSNVFGDEELKQNEKILYRQKQDRSPEETVNSRLHIGNKPRNKPYTSTEPDEFFKLFN